MADITNTQDLYTHYTQGSQQDGSGFLQKSESFGVANKSRIYHGTIVVIFCFMNITMITNNFRTTVLLLQLHIHVFIMPLKQCQITIKTIFILIEVKHKYNVVFKCGKENNCRFFRSLSMSLNASQFFKADFSKYESTYLDSMAVNNKTLQSFNCRQKKHFLCP